MARDAFGAVGAGIPPMPQSAAPQQPSIFDLIRGGNMLQQARQGQAFANQPTQIFDLIRNQAQQPTQSQIFDLIRAGMGQQAPSYGGYSQAPYYGGAPSYGAPPSYGVPPGYGQPSPQMAPPEALPPMPEPAPQLPPEMSQFMIPNTRPLLNAQKRWTGQGYEPANTQMFYHKSTGTWENYPEGEEPFVPADLLALVQKYGPMGMAGAEPSWGQTNTGSFYNPESFGLGPASLAPPTGLPPAVEDMDIVLQGGQQPGWMVDLKAVLASPWDNATLSRITEIVDKYRGA